MISMRFTDSGQGILSKIENSIFDLFYTTKEKGEGTGVGLAICKNIMQAHKGDITYQKTKDHWFFEVKLPMAE